MKREGFFITVEGLDGAGKSTQIDFIKKYFEDRGIKYISTREPGGTPISEKIRSIILDRNHIQMVPMTEALLYAASRAQHVAQIIGPALDRGKVVICDRFVDSSVAYQSYGRDLGSSVSIINEYAVMGYIPDLTLLIKVDPVQGRARIDSEYMDRLETENHSFHMKVQQGYLKLEEEYPERIVGIDGNKTAEEVSKAIEIELDKHFPRR